MKSDTVSIYFVYILYLATTGYEGDIFRNAASFSLVEICRILRKMKTSIFRKKTLNALITDIILQETTL